MEYCHFLCRSWVWKLENYLLKAAGESSSSNDNLVSCKQIYWDMLTELYDIL